MNNKTTNLKEFQLIESIIIAFRSEFICAIKRNLHDSFVVAQLSACLLEQFSGFLYTGPVSVRVQQFLYEYMEPYGELELYEILRNSLDLKMPERLGTIMTGIPGRLLKNGYVGLDERTVIEVFTKDLAEAVQRAASDLRSDEQKKQQALVWVRDHPVYEWNSISLYTSEQESRLIDYYTPLLKKHNMFSTNTPLSFGFNFSDGGYLIAVLIDHFGGRKETTRVPLEIFIELLGLKRPAEVLSEED